MSSPPLVTAEELACLLAAPPVSAAAKARSADKTEALLGHGGVALWLTKGALLYVALQTLGLHTLPTHYLWARCAIEVLCCAVFWSTLRQPARRSLTLGVWLVGATTLFMDILLVLALPV